MSNSVTAIEFGRDYWVCTLGFEVLLREWERELTALIGSLRGQVNTIKIPAWTRFRTDDIGTVTLQSASLNTASVIVHAPAASAQKVFSRGDYISFAGEMFEVTADVTTTSGLASVPLNKRLRNNYPSGTVVEYKKPFCVMRRTDDGFPISRRAVVSSASISFREAF